MDIKQPIVKNHFRHMCYINGINLLNFLNSYTKDLIIYFLNVFWSKYHCKYGLEGYRKDSMHIRSIKWRCLMSFSIKCLYALPNVAKIMIYQKVHTWADGSFTNGEHDLEPISHMFYLCSMDVTSIEGPHMGPIKLRLHNQINIWQT